MNQSMPPAPPGKPEWKVVAVQDADPVKFAELLQLNLNLLMEQGYQLAGMSDRNGAAIITAVRHSMRGPHQMQRHPGQPPPIQGSAPRPARGTTEEHITYYYLDEGIVKGKNFDTLWQAASFAMSDLKFHPDVADVEKQHPTPVSINRVRVTSFEPKDFARLAQTGPSQES